MWKKQKHRGRFTNTQEDHLYYQFRQLFFGAFFFKKKQNNFNLAQLWVSFNYTSIFSISDTVHYFSHIKIDWTSLEILSYLKNYNF